MGLVDNIIKGAEMLLEAAGADREFIRSLPEEAPAAVAA
jgi:hypothetical protein